MRRPRIPARLRDQSGLGVVLVLGVGLLVIGMGLVANRMFDGAITSSSGHVRYEQALHLAENGIDQTLARVQKDRTYANAPALPEGLYAGSAERAWVETQAMAATPQRAPQGEFVAIKPAGRNVVYGVGWIPDRANAKRTRIVKAEYLLSAFSPAHAVLVGGDLSITGNPTIDGSGGNVHANGDLGNTAADLDIAGSPAVSGDATTAGTLTVSGSPAIGGRSAGGEPQIDIPFIDPLTEWMRHAKSPVYSANWYDLCPDGTVRAPDGASPCAGTILASGLGAGHASFRGFHLSGDTWEMSGNDGGYHGVYYARDGNIRVTGSPATRANPWRATLIADGGGDTCPSIGSGDVDVAGNPNMVAYVEGLLILAGRDVDVSGNPNQASYLGLIAAHEQVDLSGTPDIVGAVLAEDACDSSGQGGDRITGNAHITYDGALEVPIGTVIRTSLWLEL
ncbi:MAG: hypothetical protein AB1416_03985 [Actinomycetota bacterium]